MSKKITPSRNISFYICLTDWYHEIGETDIKTYPSLAFMKKHVKCYDECSIVKITLKKDGTFSASIVKSGSCKYM